MKHDIGGDLEDPRGGAYAQALGHAGQYPHDQLYGDPFAMAERAMRLQEGAAHAVQWNWRQGPPPGWPLARRLPRPSQPR